MKYQINNFCNGDPLTVQTSEPCGEFGPLVYVLCYGGSLSLQHTMSPAQAREMAAALIACADAQDAATNAEFAAHRAALEVAA